ncbi:hypothetical protein [Tsukamurella strandjordii]|uniref:Uncharacterized protein n=1 Tax=Tsukamurella strandjordii TaxID=147577 RepID=A0AA90NHU1_9ACTN|nr:hypothetical protein [Tsukamurella strandjordii]MDP0398621.1 hypothetical protein [Tsukamurella strandjordii]
MADGELAQIVDAAHEAIKGRQNMVFDGNPHEELARACERHATRLVRAAEGIFDVGYVNDLGPTTEGEAATNNIRLGVVDHERSIYNTFLAQAAEARSMASGIRETGRRILRTEGISEAEINRLIGS